MASPVLGIDLGTTNSVVAVCDGGQPRVLAGADGEAVLPSVVSFHPSGQVLTGNAARDRRMVDAAHTIFSVKRLIGRPFRSVEVQRGAERLPFHMSESPTGGVMVSARGESYTLPEVSALVLRRLRSMAELALGQSCVNAVVTVPANFNELQRTATRDAGRIAGLNVLRILNEPTAAALAYGYGSHIQQRVAVYDLGGGTFDISILDLSGDVIEVISSAGDSYLGGDDVDRVIADKMVGHFLQAEQIDLSTDTQAYERLRMAAEWLKCELSRREHAVVRIEDVAYARDGSAVDLEFQMSREELDQVTFPLVGRTFDICEHALRNAGLRPTQLDNVILVGGQTRSPKVRELVSEYFGREPLTDVDPSFVVAEGAAVQGHVLGGGAFVGRAAPTSRPAPPESARPPAGRSPLDDVPTRVAPPPPRVPTEAQSFDDEPTKVATRTEPGRPPPPSARPPLHDVRGKPVGAVTLRSMSSGPPVRPRRPTVPPPVPPDAQRSARPAPVAPPPAGATQPPPRADVSVTPFPMASAEPPSEIDVPISTAPPARESSLPPERSLPPSSTSPQPGPRPEPKPKPRPKSEPEPQPVSEPPLRVETLAEVADGPVTAPKSQPPPAVTVPPATPRKVPLLLDVTPRSLAIETTGGFCEQIIEQNAPIPTEQTRRFSTSQDKQTEVRVRVLQGEDRRVEDNQELGHVRLTRLRPATRGEVKIDVTFMIDADGTLDVRARDEATGKAQQTRIDLVGALSDKEVARMRERLSRMGSD
ncbi:MAG: Hsp70 family protein [Myxococcales bacterium]|nr:Hsp70 family protein [Myxococcales bacterium]